MTTSSIVPTNILKTHVPLIDVDKIRNYLAVVGAENYFNDPQVSTNFSTSYMNWSIPIGHNFVVDPLIYIHIKPALTFNVDSPFDANAGVLNEIEGLRQYPLASNGDSVNFKLDTCSMTIFSGEIIHALQHYNKFKGVIPQCETSTPSMSDQFHEYLPNAGAGDARSPFALYNNSSLLTTMSRNPLNYNWQPTGNPNEWSFDIVEPVFLSPLAWGLTNDDARVGILAPQTMELTYNLTNNMNRWWCSPVVNRRVLNFRFVDSPVLLYRRAALPMHINPMGEYNWPLFKIDRLTANTNTSVVASGATSQFISNSYIRNPVDTSYLIYVGHQPQALNNAFVSDTFWVIEQMQMTFNNRILFANYTKEDLYIMSKKHKNDIEYPQWMSVPYTSGGGFTYYTGVGSVLCIDVAEDIGGAIPGSDLSYPLQVQVTARNPFSTPQLGQLYVLAVQEGILSKKNGIYQEQYSVLERRQIDVAPFAPSGTYQHLRQSFGGSIFSTLKSMAHKVLGAIKHGLPIASNVSKIVGAVVPDPRVKALTTGIGVVADSLNNLLSNLGAGRRGGTLNTKSINEVSEMLDNVDEKIRDFNEHLNEISLSDSDRNDVENALNEYKKLKEQFKSLTGGGKMTKRDLLKFYDE